jgi:hypothetical protein
MKDSQTKGMSRRHFMRAAGGASAAAAAVAATSLTASEAQAYDPGEEETKARYDPDSDHVKAFYRVNGYQTLKQ